jgi:hypothetical protein
LRAEDGNGKGVIFTDEAESRLCGEGAFQQRSRVNTDFEFDDDCEEAKE